MEPAPNGSLSPAITAGDLTGAEAIDPEYRPGAALLGGVPVHASQDAQHHLIGSGADGVEAGVAVVARGPMFGHVGDASMKLQAGVGHLTLQA